MIDLSGIWQFGIDPKDVGVDQQWWRQGLPMQIRLPGSLQEQGYGEDPGLDTAWVGSIVDRSLFENPRYAPYREPGNFKVPFWLQPDKHYNGAAWYQRSIEIPTEWQGRRITLSLERPHWETTVWLDDRRLGTQDSLSTPHVYDLGIGVKPGLHRLTIRVDNRMIVDVGANAHSVSDHTQTNWNGIVGRIALEAGPAIWVRSVQVFPNIQAKTARIKIDFDSALGTPGRGTVTVQAVGRNGPYAHTPEPLVAPVQFAALGGLADLDLSTRGGHVDVEYQLGEGTLLWDEFQPALYDLTVRLDVQSGGAEHHAEHTVTFGMREIAPQGTQLAINGRPIFLRGTLECCIFPLTGYPPVDGEAWKRIIRICQAHGLNHIRFHSWCPPEAAFAAADELGFYYQVEIAAWANQGAAIGEGRPLDRWLYAEADRIVNAYGNHPSFLLMAYGNEPAGRDAEFLALWNTYWRKRDPRRAYTGGAGWPKIPENQYHNTFEPRIQLWGAGLKSRINGLPPETRTDYREYMQAAGIPVVSHEIGQWCVYPNFAEIDKYTGVLKAKNFEIFRDFLEANHMGDQAHDFLIASGKLQALCYKEEIESALRTPGHGGAAAARPARLPGPGHGAGGRAGSVLGREGLHHGGGVPPILQQHRAAGAAGQALLAHGRDAGGGHHHRALWAAAAARCADQLAAGLRRWGRGGERHVCRRRGGDRQRDSLRHDSAASGRSAAGAEAAAGRGGHRRRGGESQRFENDWDLWVFADEVETAWPAAVHVCARLDAEAQAALDEGRTVLMLLPADEVDAPAVLGFSSVFWNTAWTRNQAPHTLGILCDPAHKVFAHFPTESHSNWQWWELVHGAAAMRMDHLAPDLRPLVQVIDTWFEARRLGLLYEAQVGEGRLVVCSMDLESDLEHRLVARQMRYSLAQYLAG